MFSGTNDSVIDPGVGRKLQSYYNYYAPKSNIKSVFNIPAEHSMVTNKFGNDCDYLGPPFINNCNYDAAGEILNWIYNTRNKTLNPPVNPPLQNVQKIDQTKYTPTGIRPSEISLSDFGFMYVPTSCRSGSISCRVHMAFHGCRQYFNAIGRAFVDHAGYNEWGESNNIIVVYPQTISVSTLPYNPEGCFDWWGFTGVDYATKFGLQIVTFKNIINGL